MVFVNYGESRDKLFFQSPFMKLPFGVSEFVEDSGKKTMTITVSFQGLDTNPNVNDAHQKMLSFDRHVLDYARGEDISRPSFHRTISWKCLHPVHSQEDVVVRSTCS